jgi:hypothetical protein
MSEQGAIVVFQGCQLMETWRGHFPITNFVLGALLKKRAAADPADFSRAEAVLLEACQFWQAVATHRLAQFLAPEPAPGLILAFEAFSEIGAVRVASALRVVLHDRPELQSSTWLERQVLDLEAHLLDTEDAVDHLIAQFAHEHMDNDSPEKRPETEIPESPLDKRTSMDDAAFE